VTVPDPEPAGPIAAALGDLRARVERTLHVLVDSREQAPLAFAPETKGRRRWRIETETVCLPTADYSLRGYAGRSGEAYGIAIERKRGWDELLGNLTRDRVRFLAELDRMREFECRLIVVESATWPGLERGAYRAGIPLHVARALIDGVMERGIPVRPCHNRSEAAAYVLDCLRRYAERRILKPEGE